MSQQAMSIPSAPAGKMSLFPIGEGASINSICNTGSLEDGFRPSGLGEGMLESINRDGGPLGATITEDLANVTGQFVTKEAARGQIPELEGVSGGDIGNLKPVTAQGDINLQAVGVLAKTDTGR